jgi:hypothetical protein
MGIGRPALPILGILLAISGLVLGAFTFTSVSRLETQVANITDDIDQNSWYKYNGTTFNSDPTVTYLTFTGLTIDFELEPDEEVYFSFTSRAHTEPVLPGPAWSRIYVFFRVDGLFQSDPSAEVGMYNGAFTINHMIHLQAVRSDLSSGSHTVTVVIYGDSTANYIWKSSLFVQTVSI